MSAVVERTREAYDAIFEVARGLAYPEVDAFEQRMGYSIPHAGYEAAARVLACPLKANPPHWQHGRIIYAATRARAWRLSDGEPMRLLDVGSAKGFSALCLLWAVWDIKSVKDVYSVDVIDPEARTTRNTVAELNGQLTLAETMAPWPEARMIHFAQSTGIDWLTAHPERIHVAFIDGKHEGHVVRQEGKLLAQRQGPGDLALFDDCQMPGVSQAVVSLEEFWKFEYLAAGPRTYAVGWRR